VFRIRISLNVDPDPDPGFHLNADADSRFRILDPDLRPFLPKNLNQNKNVENFEFFQHLFRLLIHNM